jgi:hypothetical protein
MKPWVEVAIVGSDTLGKPWDSWRSICRGVQIACG